MSALSLLGTVFLYVGVALFLTLALEPLIQFSVRRGLPRWGAVCALSLGGVLTLTFMATVIAPAVSSQVVSLTVQLFESLQHVPEQEWFQWLSGIVSDAVDLEKLAGDAAAFFGDPEKILAISGGILKVGTGIIDGVTGVFIVTALTVYFALTLPAIKAKGYALVARPVRPRVSEITDEILQSVGRYVGGQLILATISATVTFVLTSSVGSPAPVVLATIAFVGALIPIFGPVVASAVTVAVTLTHDVTAGILVAAVLVTYMQVEAYVLTPRVMSRAVAVPGPLVIVAALGGAALGGVLGAFVAVPIAAAAITLVDGVAIPFQDRAR